MNLGSKPNYQKIRQRLDLIDPKLSGKASNPLLVSGLIEKLEKSGEKYILDYAAMGDLTPAYLSKLGHKHIYAIDDDKKIYGMPYYTQIKYSYSPLGDTHYPQSFFDIIFSLDSKRTLADLDSIKSFISEANRILSNKGKLIFPIIFAGRGKSGSKSSFFTSTKFSSQEILSLLSYATEMGFGLIEKDELNGPESTLLLEFALLKKEKINKIRKINLVVATLGKGEGMDVCYQTLKKRFDQTSIKATLYKTYEEADKRYPTIIGYVPSYELKFPKNGNYMIDAHQTQASSRFWLEVKNILKDIIRNPMEFFRVAYILIFHFKYAFQTTKRLKTSDNKELGNHLLVLRTNELAQASGFKDYVIMPLAAFGKPHIMKHAQKELHIGSFGFATKGKHFDQICELAKRLDVKATIWMGASRFNSTSQSTTNFIAQDVYNRYNSDRTKVKVGEFKEEDLLKGLNDCTHFISAQGEVMVTSASLRHMIWLGRPVVSLDNYIAKESQVHRVKSLNSITKEYLESTRELTNLDDGFRYLLKILEHVDFSKESFKKE